MVTKVISQILDLIANAMNILVCTILDKMDLSLNTLETNIPGLVPFYKVMVLIGVVVVFFCIIAEAINLITSPFSGQARQGGFSTILRCLFAGIAVVLVFQVCSAVIGEGDKGIQGFYKQVISMSREVQISPEVRKAKLQILKDKGETPESAIRKFASYQKMRDDYIKKNQIAYAKKLDLSNTEVIYNARLAYQVLYGKQPPTQANLKEDLVAQFNTATDGAGSLFLESNIPIFGLPAAAASLYITAVVIILLVRFVQLVLSLLMRYITFGLMIYMGPMCVGFAASPMTSQITRTWIRTVISQIILFLTMSWGISVMYQSLMNISYNMSVFDLVIRIAFVLVFGKVILKMDEILNRLGFNTMPTLDNARSGMMGAVGMGLMAFRAFKGGSGGGGGKGPEKTSTPKKSSAKMNSRGEIKADQGKWRSTSNKARTNINDKLGTKIKPSQNAAQKQFNKYNDSLKNSKAMSGKDFKAATGIDGTGPYKIAEDRDVCPIGKGSVIAPLDKVGGGTVNRGEYAAMITPNSAADYNSSPHGDAQGVTGNERLSGPTADYNFVRDKAGNPVEMEMDNLPKGAHAYLLQHKSYAPENLPQATGTGSGGAGGGGGSAHADHGASYSSRQSNAPTGNSGAGSSGQRQRSGQGNGKSQQQKK